MASRVEFAVSVTPVVNIGQDTSIDASSHDVIGGDVGKALGGSANVSVGQEVHTTVGYGTSTAGEVVYLDAATGTKTQMGADATAYDMVFIKNPGFIYSTATTLGASSSLALDVYIEYTATSAWAKIASIPAGGAIVLPSFPSQGAGKGIFVQPASGSDNLAVEYILVT
jgi:hypothetical protein